MNDQPPHLSPTCFCVRLPPKALFLRPSTIYDNLAFCSDTHPPHLLLCPAEAASGRTTGGDGDAAMGPPPTTPPLQAFSLGGRAREREKRRDRAASGWRFCVCVCAPVCAQYLSLFLPASFFSLPPASFLRPNFFLPQQDGAPWMHALGCMCGTRPRAASAAAPRGAVVCVKRDQPLRAIFRRAAGGGADEEGRKRTGAARRDTAALGASFLRRGGGGRGLQMWRRQQQRRLASDDDRAHAVGRGKTKQCPINPIKQKQA